VPNHAGCVIEEYGFKLMEPFRKAVAHRRLAIAVVLEDANLHWRFRFHGKISGR
jgi:hypothetical protein